MRLAAIKKWTPRTAPYVVLFGALAVGVLALPQMRLLPPEAFHWALAVVVFFFTARAFHRHALAPMRRTKPKPTAAEKRDELRRRRKYGVWTR